MAIFIPTVVMSSPLLFPSPTQIPAPVTSKPTAVTAATPSMREACVIVSVAIPGYAKAGSANRNSSMAMKNWMLKLTWTWMQKHILKRTLRLRLSWRRMTMRTKKSLMLNVNVNVRRGHAAPTAAPGTHTRQPVMTKTQAPRETSAIMITPAWATPRKDLGRQLEAVATVAWIGSSPPI